MEIIVIPYLAVSFAIGWAIFAPFSQFDDLEQMSLARIQSSDLLAFFLPTSVLFAVASTLVPAKEYSTAIIAFVSFAVLLASLSCFVVSLFLLAKMEDPPILKRMVLIGVVIPLGLLMTIAWIVLPLVAYAFSAFYSMIGLLAVVPITFGLRALSRWVCESTELQP